MKRHKQIDLSTAYRLVSLLSDLYSEKVYEFSFFSDEEVVVYMIATRCRGA